MPKTDLNIDSDKGVREYWKMERRFFIYRMIKWLFVLGILVIWYLHDFHGLTLFGN